MTTESQKPLASQALLDYLDAIYPDRAPSPSISQQEVWVAAGQVSVVRKLKADIKEATRKDED